MITDFIFNPVPAGDRMGILILILPHSSSVGGNLKSPEALNVWLCIVLILVIPLDRGKSGNLY